LSPITHDNATVSVSEADHGLASDRIRALEAALDKEQRMCTAAQLNAEVFERKYIEAEAAAALLQTTLADTEARFTDLKSRWEQRALETTQATAEMQAALKDAEDARKQLELKSDRLQEELNVARASSHLCAAPAHDFVSIGCCVLADQQLVVMESKLQTAPEPGDHEVRIVALEVQLSDSQAKVVSQTRAIEVLEAQVAKLKAEKRVLIKEVKACRGSKLRGHGDATTPDGGADASPVDVSFATTGSRRDSDVSGVSELSEPTPRSGSITRVPPLDSRAASTLHNRRTSAPATVLSGVTSAIQGRVGPVGRLSEGTEEEEAGADEKQSQLDSVHDSTATDSRSSVGVRDRPPRQSPPAAGDQGSESHHTLWSGLKSLMHNHHAPGVDAALSSGHERRSGSASKKN
jgi:multidrug efflux pump subunit AcrA (membrane-fusion protein)